MTTTKYDTRLLERTEEQVSDCMTPETALRLVARLRRVTFFMHYEMDQPIDGDDEHKYSHIGAMELTAKQVRKDMLEGMQAANKRRAKLDKPLALVKVTRFGDCVFFGGL